MPQQHRATRHAPGDNAAYGQPVDNSGHEGDCCAQLLVDGRPHYWMPTSHLRSLSRTGSAPSVQFLYGLSNRVSCAVTSQFGGGRHDEEQRITRPKQARDHSLRHADALRHHVPGLPLRAKRDPAVRRLTSGVLYASPNCNGQCKEPNSSTFLNYKYFSNITHSRFLLISLKPNLFIDFMEAIFLVLI